MRFGVWTPLPHTIAPEDRMADAIRTLESQGSGRGPADAYQFAVEVLQRGERYGFDISLVAARHLGPDLDAWTLAPALGARTKTMELMVAAHPGMHPPQLMAKMAATLDRITGGRVSINVINGWNIDEFNLFGNGAWLEDAADRHLRMDEYVQVLTGLWRTEPFNFSGRYYRVADGLMPLRLGRSAPPAVYATSQSPEGMETVARYCDHWFVPDARDYRKFDETVRMVRGAVARMRALAAEWGRKVGFAISGQVICTDDPAEAVARADALEAYGNIRRYNKSAAGGLGACLVGSPRVIADRIRTYEELGVEVMMLSFSPMLAGLDTFAREVMPLLGRGRAAA